MIRRERIDVIHAHNYEGALIGFLGWLLSGRPLIYNAINTMSDELPSYGFIRPRALAVGLARLLDHVVPRLADRILAISPELTAFLAEQRIADDRVELIPLGVDLTPFDGRPDPAIRERYSIPDGRLVLYTGILDAFQRVDDLVRAMSVVAGECPDARLVLATNLAKDEDVEACRGLTRELGSTAASTCCSTCPSRRPAPARRGGRGRGLAPGLSRLSGEATELHGGGAADRRLPGLGQGTDRHEERRRHGGPRLARDGRRHREAPGGRGSRRKSSGGKLAATPSNISPGRR